MPPPLRRPASASARGRASAAAGDPRFDVPHLLEPLSSPDAHIRQATCQKLAIPELKYDPRVVKALVERMQDGDRYVRQAAAAALGQVARRNDDSVTAALIGRLNDSDSSTRRCATNALAQIGERDVSSAAVVALVGRLEDKDGGVRRAALKALEKLADKTDASVLVALFGRTSDSEAFVRHTAVEVLGRLADEGSPEVVARLLELLNSDRDSRVRWAATEALGRLAVRGDSRVLQALLARLEDEADSVRRAAANALGHVTFAPLQELELQERQIAELEYRGQHEVASRDKTIAELETRHAAEVKRLEQRIEELEMRLHREVSMRDHRIEQLEEQTQEQEWFCRVSEFLPHAGRVTQFLAGLPALAGPNGHGQEIWAPIWALRYVSVDGSRSRAGSPTKDRSGSANPSQRSRAGSPTKDKRWVVSVFELFEQLSTGRMTPMELTDKKPLDVYVHRTEEGSWGLYCCSRHRLLALLMRQACSRNELFTVRCIIRPTDDASYWGWQWSNFYDGGNGLTVHVNQTGTGRSVPCSPSDSRLSLGASSSNAWCRGQADGRGSSEPPSTPQRDGRRVAGPYVGEVGRGTPCAVPPAPWSDSAAAARQLGSGGRICILGGSKLQGPNSEEIVETVAKELSEELGRSVVYVTCGLPGAQEIFARRAATAGSRVCNLLPVGHTSAYGVGEDIFAGASAEERTRIFGQLGDVYLAFEGGPDVAKEAAAVIVRGAALVPLMRIGGASGGACGFPEAALKKPAFATVQQWACLSSSTARVVEAARAAADIVKFVVSQAPDRERATVAQPLAEDEPASANMYPVRSPRDARAAPGGKRNSGAHASGGGSANARRTPPAPGTSRSGKAVYSDGGTGNSAVAAVLAHVARTPPKSAASPAAAPTPASLEGSTPPARTVPAVKMDLTSTDASAAR
eukprot:gnl/TRDRNA2_/TRDRNA2_165361_c0_seq1.p1 gnl/TRDRNA2_/TRDRNA2_165361_c0~~gnl/TRDRNA2_/TRDRNA2_165361_c0_seq1.p1  ORF type:complete len:919 (+),score=167.55 gnl/TRDRNA2_/TRDRNA2_165361_c0_seq1:50-2806(+)